MKHERGPLWLLPAVYYLIFLLLLISYWFVYALSPEFHAEWLQDEDHLIEWLTFMSFAMAAVFMAMIFKYHRKMDRWTFAYLLCVTLFCFVCAGEEISWAQRVVGFETPERIADFNEQGEFNLHNLNFENLHPQSLATLCMQTIGVFLPILLCRSTYRPTGRFRRYCAPLYMVPCFVFADSLNAIQSRLKPWLAERFGTDMAIMVRSDTRELSEMFWGLCMLFTAFALYAAWERYQPAPKPADTGAEPTPS